MLYSIIMFHIFCQAVRNDTPKFSQLWATFHLQLDWAALQHKDYLIQFRLKLQQN